MPIEWGWIPPARPVPVGDEGLRLPSQAGCEIVLFHGLTGTPTELGYLAHHLRRRGGHSVRVPRLANHGQPIGLLARTKWQDILQGAREALASARDDARARGVPLVAGGLSLGAILALVLAAEEPEGVDGVVCLSPTLFYDGWNVPWYRRLLPIAAATPLKHFSYFRESEPFGLRDEELRRKMAAAYGEMTLRESAASGALGYAHFPVRLFCEMRPLVALCKRALPSVRSPVLVVQAEKDDMTSRRNADYIRERVGSSRSELLLLKDSYHLVTVDLEREAVAASTARFCSSLLAQDASRHA